MEERFIDTIREIEANVDAQIDAAEAAAREKMEQARKDYAAAIQRARMDAANVRSDILASAEERSREELAEKSGAGTDLDVPQERLDTAKERMKERIVNALGHR